MDIRKFLPSKRRVCEDQDDNSESESDSGMVEHEEMPDIATTSKSSKALSVKAAQKKGLQIKAHISMSVGVKVSLGVLQ